MTSIKQILGALMLTLWFNTGGLLAQHLALSEAPPKNDPTVSTSTERAELSLTEAYALLADRYPLLKNDALDVAILEQDLIQLDANRKPQIQVLADLRQQTESVQLQPEGNVQLPFEIDQPTTSGKLWLDGSYALYDGRVHKASRQQKEAALIVKQQQTKVERYQLQTQLNQAFIQVVFLREQSALLALSIDDLKARISRVNAAIEEGTALPSEATKLTIKVIELTTQQDNINNQIDQQLSIISSLIGEKLAKNVQLSFPEMGNAATIPNIGRPEYEVFDAQRAAVGAQAELIDATRQPKINAYAQAGIGYPNPLNFIDNNLAPFGVIGIRGQWSITDWKKSDAQKEILHLQQLKIDNQEATLTFNLEKGNTAFLKNIERIEQQIKSDQNIADLHAQLLAQLRIQLDEGIITTTDYLLQSNAELSARQQITIHQTELLQTQLNFWNLRGALN